MEKLSDLLTNEVHTAAIAGHVRPDGDCIGTNTALYLYIKKNYPLIDVKLYLEEPKAALLFLKGCDKMISETPADESVDLFISCDASEKERIAVAGNLLPLAKKSVCIDHHISNTGFADVNIIVPEASSSAEVLYGLLEDEKIDKDCAEALYTGIIHDTGVFQYKNTSPYTMTVAAALMKKGIDFCSIIDNSFNIRTHRENQILGRTLLESVLMLDGRVIVGTVTHRDMAFYDVTQKDLDGIVAQLRLTKGVEVAVFIYECEPQVYKVSLRSNSDIDVSEIAAAFEGGGHIRAAGCTMYGTDHDVINNLMGVIQEKVSKEHD
ncbi:MAG TPA: bifunctional oligoribonuclease/PAP phosphatase NrnA [Lachnospiraceae bacterium]|nr:bifunctional oligoribonuclease/PAP phosphatase NrnA [Lachnospiraceae bacterium]